MRTQATVKWFNDSKGYGFVLTDDGRDAFIHWTEIRGEGFKTLAEGQRIECTLIDSQSLQASDVEKIWPCDMN